MGVTRLLVRAALLCGIALLPVAFSAWIDPARVLGAPDAEHAIATAIVAGHDVTNVMNYDDRAIERLLAWMRTGRIDVLAIGSSRLQPLSHDAFPGQRFVNASLAAARFDDFLGVAALYDRSEHKPTRVLLSLDPWSLSSDPAGMLWGPLARERASMLDTLGIGSSVLRDRFDGALFAAKRIGAPEYFRLSVFSLRHHGVHGIQYTVTDVAEHDEKTKLADGSIMWPPTTAQSADSIARDYVRQVREHIAPFNGDVVIDQGRTDMLARLLRHWKQEGMDVEIVLAPFHPLVYAEFGRQSRSNIGSVERTYRAIATAAGVRVIGAYDPVVTGMTTQDFYDESHMRTESLARLVVP